MTGGATATLIELVIEEPEWAELVPDLEALANAAAARALEAARVDPAHRSISLLACSDSRISVLNREFRGKAQATNVLSWPAFALAPSEPGRLPPSPPEPQRGVPQPLGDVAIALQTTRREAAERAIPLKDHVIHLILHGCLHLLGFDHETNADAEVMEGIETRALARMGVADPYMRGNAGQPHPDR